MPTNEVRRTRVTALHLLAGTVIVLACHTPTDTRDSRACLQSGGEFGFTGCADVRGQVVGSAGQALSGVFVSMRAVSDGDLYSPMEADATTDMAGSFRVRALRFVGHPPAGGAPDTIPVRITAAYLRGNGTGTPTIIRDSVRVTVTVAPIGVIPTPADVRITLPVQ